MSTKKSDIDDKCDVIVKLDKVADTLENASNQLSGAVTQQQLDLACQRVSFCEVELTTIKAGMEVLAQRSAVHADESETAKFQLIDRLDFLENDLAGLRALTLSAFALCTISLIGLIIFGVLCL